MCSNMEVATNASKEFLKRTGFMLYIMNPHEHLFETVDQVPDYYKQVTPSFIFIVTLEQFIKLIMGKPMFRINDSITNISQGMLVEIFKIPLYGIELLAYTWIYNNCRLFSLPWDSAWTWLLCLVGTDFCFYWMHRATHQISVLWLFHEPHHSSEEYNMTVPLRLSVFTSSTLWLTYLPMAFVIPPSTFFVHYQLNIIFQYWLHTELIPPIRFLDWFLVTPSHHRVHHGRNRRCIDKNFGSFLIIWDKIFGTFEPEGKEKIFYGVTSPIQTFNPYSVQINHLKNIHKLFFQVKGIRNKLSAVFKGPGWSPGKPWLGYLNDIPEPEPGAKKYDPFLPMWKKMYAVLHCAASVIGYVQMILYLKELSSETIVACCLFIGLSTIALGVLLDGSAWISVIELFRCLMYFVVESVICCEAASRYIIPSLSMKFFRALFSGSLLFWIVTMPIMRFRPRTKIHSG